MKDRETKSVEGGEARAVNDRPATPVCRAAPVRRRQMSLPAGPLAFLVGTALAFGLAPVSAMGSGAGTLRLTILDANGKPTPALVSLRNAVTRQNHVFGEDRLRILEVEEYGRSLGARQASSKRPEWRDELARDSDGTLGLSLPPGKYALHVGKGIEYESVRMTFDVREGEAETINVTLKRFCHMPEEGWWSGDAHVHVTRKSAEADREIFLSAMAEDIHVVNALQAADVTRTYFHQHAFGPEGRARLHEHAIVPGQEEPRTHILGHTLALNTAYFVRNAEPYLLYDKALREIREHGGLTGYAHVRGYWFDRMGSPVEDVRGMKRDQPLWNGIVPLDVAFNGDLGLMLDVPEGLVDFVELLDARGMLDPTYYYELLNMGFRLPVTAGSDFPFGFGHIGDNRTYVYTGRGAPFSVDRWFERLAQGKTFVTQGPLIDFRVDGNEPGATLVKNRGDLVVVTASAKGHPEVGSPKDLSLIRFGEAMETLGSEDPNQAVVEGKWTIPVEKSCWIAVRVTAHNGAVAHTSPVYVVVDRQPTWDPAQLQALVDRRLDRIRRLRETLVQGPSEAATPDAMKGEFERIAEQIASWTESREAFLARLNRCEEIYQGLLQKSRKN